MESTVLLGYEVVRFTEVNIYSYKNTIFNHINVHASISKHLVLLTIS